LQMLAATYSETGKYQKAVVTAQQALELATHQRNDELAAAITGDITQYETRVRQAGGRVTAQQP